MDIRNFWLGHKSEAGNKKESIISDKELASIRVMPAKPNGKAPEYKFNIPKESQKKEFRLASFNIPIQIEKADPNISNGIIVSGLFVDGNIGKVVDRGSSFMISKENVTNSPDDRKKTNDKARVSISVLPTGEVKIVDYTEVQPPDEWGMEKINLDDYFFYAGNPEIKLAKMYPDPNAYLSAITEIIRLIGTDVNPDVEFTGGNGPVIVISPNFPESLSVANNAEVDISLDQVELDYSESISEPNVVRLEPTVENGESVIEINNNSLPVSVQLGTNFFYIVMSSDGQKLELQEYPNLENKSIIYTNTLGEGAQIVVGNSAGDNFNLNIAELNDKPVIVQYYPTGLVLRHNLPDNFVYCFSYIQNNEKV